MSDNSQLGDFIPRRVKAVLTPSDAGVTFTYSFDLVLGLG